MEQAKQQKAKTKGLNKQETPGPHAIEHGELLAKVAQAAKNCGGPVDYMRPEWSLQPTGRVKQAAQELLTEVDWRNAKKLAAGGVPVVLLDIEQRMIWRVATSWHGLVLLVQCKTKVATRQCWARLLRCNDLGAEPTLHLPVASAKRPWAEGFGIYTRREGTLTVLQAVKPQVWHVLKKCETLAELDEWWNANVRDNPLALEV